MGLLDSLKLKPTAALKSRAEWDAAKPAFDDALHRFKALERSGHPKSAALRQVLGVIQGYAAGQQYAKASAALRELLPKMPAPAKLWPVLRDGMA